MKTMSGRVGKKKRQKKNGEKCWLKFSKRMKDVYRSLLTEKK